MDAVMDLDKICCISSLLGQISFKKTYSLEEFLPNGSFKISFFIDPVKAYATTNGGDAK